MRQKTSWRWWLWAAPPPPILGVLVLRPIPFGVGVSFDSFSVLAVAVRACTLNSTPRVTSCVARCVRRTLPAWLLSAVTIVLCVVVRTQ